MSDHRTRRGRAVLVVDDDGALLLLRGRDPARPEAGTWWFTPGGGLDEGESAEAAARAASCGRRPGSTRVTSGPSCSGAPSSSTSKVCTTASGSRSSACGVPGSRSTTTGWTEVERRSVLGHRWWTHADLVTTDETLHPPELPQILRDLLGHDCTCAATLQVAIGGTGCGGGGRRTARSGG